MQEQLLPDAQRLLGQAQGMLLYLSPDHPAYGGLSAAIQALDDVINSSPSATALAAAMSRLTQAMAAAQ